MNTCYALSWTEYERGWGQRPDGVTLCATKAIAEARYNAAFTNRGGSTPDEYSNPSEPYLVEVTSAAYKLIQQVGARWFTPSDRSWRV